MKNPARPAKGTTTTAGACCGCDAATAPVKSHVAVAAQHDFRDV